MKSAAYSEGRSMDTWQHKMWLARRGFTRKRPGESLSFGIHGFAEWKWRGFPGVIVGRF